MAAATISDLDGIGVAFSLDLYNRFHHMLGHNLAFALIVSGILACWSERGRHVQAFALYVGLMHVHFGLDLVGSGMGWGIAYLWPISQHVFESPVVWGLFSWQNTVCFLGLLLWLSAIMVRQRRTPLELLMPELDRKLVEFVRPA